MSAQRRLALWLTCAGLAMLAGLLVVAAAPVPVGARAAAPTLSAVTPNTAANDLDTTLTITGTGLSAVLSGTAVITPPEVLLGGIPWAELAHRGGGHEQL